MTGAPGHRDVDRENHPAVVAARISRERVSARDKQGWLDNFADDAVVEDPVGPSLFDEHGTGHRGRDALAAFWDATIATTERLDFAFDEEIICGNEVAYIGQIVTHIGGYVTTARGVFLYRADDAGKLAALRAFWEVDRTMGSMRPA